MRLARAWTPALLAVALCLAVSGPAHGVGWTPAVPLTPSTTASAGTTIEADNVQLLVSPSGAQVITWDNHEIGPDSNNCISAEARTRVPGGNWSATTTIGCEADIQIGSDGTAVALWEDNAGGGNTVLKSATAIAGSPFGATQTVDQTNTAHSGRVAAIDPSGRVTVAWQEYRPVPPSEQYDLVAKTQNADGTWPAGRETVEVGHTRTANVLFNYGLAIAAGASGDVVIAANTTDPVSKGTTANYKRVVAYTRLAPGGAWTPATVLGPSPTIYPTIPLLAPDPQGRITLMEAVQRGDLTGSPYKLYAWTRPANTSGWPGVPEEVGSANGTQLSPKAGLALDSNGNAQTAFHYSTDGSNYSIRAATRTAGSTTWQANAPPEVGPTPCNSGSNGLAPDVAFDSSDTATISMQCSSGPLMFRRVTGSSSYSQFTAPAAGGQGVQISTDGAGYLVATWIENGVVYTSVYDAVAPSLDGFEAGGSAVAGQAVSFTVSGSDVWGPVTWSVDFGDGQPVATGRTYARSGQVRARAVASGAVTHTYSAPGTYTATITVNDSAANSVTQSRVVDVAQAPAQTPAPVPPVPGLPDPILGRTVNIAPVKQPVRVREPGSRRFVPLTAPKQVRVGSIIDTRKGRVRITIQNRRRTFDTADFYSGMFRVAQLVKGSGIATMELFGGRFRGCPKAPRVRLSATRRSGKRAVRKLWGNGTGAFRTKGRFSAASIRGTTWLTEDRCNGTLTKVRVGKVAVRDFVRRKTVVVTARKQYFAAARARRR